MKPLRKSEQAEKLRVSRWTVDRIAKTDPTFPPEFPISPGVKARDEDQLDDWLRSRQAATQKPAGDK